MRWIAHYSSRLERIDSLWTWYPGLLKLSGIYVPVVVGLVQTGKGGIIVGHLDAAELPH